MEGMLIFCQRRECEEGFTEVVEFINSDISRWGRRTKDDRPRKRPEEKKENEDFPPINRRLTFIAMGGGLSESGSGRYVQASF